MTTRIDVDGPKQKWTITMATLRQSVLSREPVCFDVAVYNAGLILNPTTGTFEAAFLTGSRAEPVTGDWKAGTWDTTLIGGYVGQVTVGPGGAFVPSKGRYYCWVRVTLGTQIVVRPVGKLFID